MQPKTIELVKKYFTTEENIFYCVMFIGLKYFRQRENIVNACEINCFEFLPAVWPV